MTDTETVAVRIGMPDGIRLNPTAALNVDTVPVKLTEDVTVQARLHSGVVVEDGRAFSAKMDLPAQVAHAMAIALGCAVEDLELDAGEITAVIDPGDVAEGDAPAGRAAWTAAAAPTAERITPEQAAVVRHVVNGPDA